MKKNKKKVLKTKKLLFFVVAIILILIIFFSGIKTISEKLFENKTEKFLAANDSQVTLYNSEYQEISKTPRGTKVKVYSKLIENGSKKYYKIIQDNKEYLVEAKNVVDKVDNTVLEKTKYVRTPVTLYENNSTINIASAIPKGEQLEVIDFNKLDDSGNVDMYKVKYKEVEGYVYSKYLVNDKEKALLNYDEEGTYKTHSKRGNTLGGGSAANLDYYPYEKASFEDNVMPKEVRTLYLNSVVVKNVDSYIEFAKKNNINAFVVDIKDNQSPGYKSDIMKEYSPTNYNKANNSLQEYQKSIKKLIDNDFYVIGRITVFKDSYYVKDHPEDAITSTATGKPFLHNSSYWPTAYSRNVWEFNVKLAVEAVKLMGFHEIQFDYVRFPDRTRTLEKNNEISLHNVFKEDKAQAIQQFLMYATDEIHKVNAYVSADVFGESAHNYVTAYGQYWPAISNVVDVISAMPYPDHFSIHEYGINEIVWTVPYKVLDYWAKNYVVKQQAITTSKAVVRTWIQAYDAVRKPHIVYDDAKISEQIKALYDNGLDGGYMTWNASSNLNKYKQIAPAFQKEY